MSLDHPATQPSNGGRTRRLSDMDMQLARSGVRELLEMNNIDGVARLKRSIDSFGLLEIFMLCAVLPLTLFILIAEFYASPNETVNELLRTDFFGIGGERNDLWNYLLMGGFCCVLVVFCLFPGAMDRSWKLAVASLVTILALVGCLLSDAYVAKAIIACGTALASLTLAGLLAALTISVAGKIIFGFWLLRGAMSASFGSARRLLIACGPQSSIRRPVQAFRRAFLCPSYLDALPKDRTLPTFLFCGSGIMFGISTTLLLYELLLFSSTFYDLFLNYVTVQFWSGNTILPTVALDRLSTACVEAPSELVECLPETALGLVSAGLLRLTASWVYEVGRKKSALAYQGATNDTRPPILYLRSFREDNIVLSRATGKLSTRVFRFRTNNITLDEIVLDVGSQYGPVIAIGRPDEVVRPLGAARLYVRDGNWQDYITRLASQARIIIIAVDETAGVSWELKHVLTNGYLSKAIFLANPEKGEQTLVSVIEGICLQLGLIQARSVAPFEREIISVSETADGCGIETRSKLFGADEYWCALNRHISLSFLEDNLSHLVEV